MDPYLACCPACRRHVHAGTVTCPFCEGRVPASSGRRAPRTRLSRPQILAFGAAVSAAALLGCGSSTAPEDDGGVDAGAMVRVDAGPGGVDSGARDAGGTDAGGTDAGTDAGLAADAGDDAGFDAGQIALPYGAPPLETRWV